MTEPNDPARAESMAPETAKIGSASPLPAAVHTSGGFSLTAQGAKYPSEVPDEMLVGDKVAVFQNVITFHAEGALWNDDLVVVMTGFASYNSQWPIAYPHSHYPHIPANHFISVGFAVGGHSDTLTFGNLDVNIVPYGQAVGSAYEPKVAFEVSGRFNPTGPGDTNYYFHMMIDTLCNVTVANAQSDHAQISIYDEHVLVWLGPLWQGSGT